MYEARLLTLQVRYISSISALLTSAQRTLLGNRGAFRVIFLRWRLLAEVIDDRRQNLAVFNPVDPKGG